MLRLLLKLTLAGAFLFALWAWVPLGEQTLAERWRSAGSPLEFVRRGVAEAGLGDTPGARPGGRGARKDHPAERVTEAERRALDRRLAEELARDAGR